ncbi:MAG TPA: aldehyde dehydrogenase family protein, partial [Tepidisphaeraceae bacterium]|nr:aldehyde dehydrogenase family protein [Tepidisphaeraceae bacterium]
METKKNYLNGQWVGGGEAFDVVNPATGEVFARVSSVSREQVHRAIDDAQAAFEGWRSLPAKARGDYLLAIADQLSKRADDVARLMTMENGKPLGQSKGEVAGSVDHLRWFAEECRRAYGRVIPNQVAGKRHLVIKS